VTDLARAVTLPSWGAEAQDAVLDLGVGSEARRAVPLLDVLELGLDGLAEGLAVGQDQADVAVLGVGVRGAGAVAQPGLGLVQRDIGQPGVGKVSGEVVVVGVGLLPRAAATASACKARRFSLRTFSASGAY
jgi:hypothetical protein